MALCGLAQRRAEVQRVNRYATARIIGDGGDPGCGNPRRYSEADVRMVRVLEHIRLDLGGVGNNRNAGFLLRFSEHVRPYLEDDPIPEVVAWNGRRLVVEPPLYPTEDMPVAYWIPLRKVATGGE